MSFYYLEVTRGVEVGRRYLLADGAISIGRSSQNTIALSAGEKSVSSHHAIIYKSPDRILLQDMQSTNGLFVGQEKVTEKELSPNDEIGFGKSGPRMKLIISERELSTEPPPKPNNMASQDSTNIKTMDNDARFAMMQTSDATSNENQDTIAKMKLGAPQSLGKNPFKPSLTMEFQNKLADKNINANDMKKLMSDGKRLERVLDNGNFGQTQTNMLRTVYSANRKMNKQWMYILAVVVFVSLIVSTFFAVRALQYKHLLDTAQTLRKTMDEYDKKIAAAKVDPNANEQKLKQLISEMEQKETDFSQVQTQINQQDMGKIYTDPLEKSIDQILQRYGESDYHIPKEMVDRVRYHLDTYTGSLHSSVGRYLQRKAMYFPMMQKTFREKNVPVELAYVAMLESGYNPMALSHCGARGIWQFMPETGKRYHLVVDGAIDERTDPLKATIAAAQFFKELISIFGGKSSVMLCMAAYNAGEGRIMGALRKIDDPVRNRDFWYIYRMGYLAEETNEYIPRVIALMIIAEHPQEYGFTSKGPSTAPLEQENDFVEVDFKVK